jgi:hypothetical protein
MTRNEILHYLIDHPSESDRADLFKKLFEEAKKDSWCLGCDSYKSFINLPHCPDYIREYYVQYCADWLCKGNRWDRRGTTLYVTQIKKFDNLLSKESIKKLLESLNEFGETKYTKPLISYFSNKLKKKV